MQAHSSSTAGSLLKHSCLPWTRTAFRTSNKVLRQARNWSCSSESPQLTARQSSRWCQRPLGSRHSLCCQSAPGSALSPSADLPIEDGLSVGHSISWAVQKVAPYLLLFLLAVGVLRHSVGPLSAAFALVAHQVATTGALGSLSQDHTAAFALLACLASCTAFQPSADSLSFRWKSTSSSGGTASPRPNTRLAATGSSTAGSSKDAEKEPRNGANGSNGKGPKKGKGNKEGENLETISIENAELVAQSAGNALTELGNVQTPASVWLPYRDTNTGRNTLQYQLGPAVITIGGRMGRALMQFLRMPSHLVSLLSFKAQQIMLASTATKLVAVFVVGVPLCLLGGVFYSWTSGKSIVDGIINAYGALYKIPGVMVIGEINARTAHLMNILWLIGTFTFAIVLGVVTEDIVNTVIGIKAGNHPVISTNHTLILNWNSQTVPLLKQIAINKLERANGAYEGPVVILAERDKVEMDNELRSALKGFSLEWHTRVGSPHSIGDLERVSAGQARTIILLDPEDEEDVGKKQVAAILGVQSARAMTKPRPFLRLMPQNIAVQVPENAADRDLLAAAGDIMAASAQKFKLTYLSCKRDMSTLLAQSAVQPGVASVYCTIVQQTQRGVEFYLKRFPELSGLTFGEARRMFDTAVLCGYIRNPSGGEGPQLFVNPDDSDVLNDTDRVIALAQTGRFKPASRSKKDNQRRARGSELTKYGLEGLQERDDPGYQHPKHLVVAWFEGSMADLSLSLAAFAPRGSSVTVISKEKPEGYPEENRIAGTSFAFVQGDPAQMDLLNVAGVQFSDAIIVGGTDSRPDKEADALTLSMVMLTQECLAVSGRDPGNPAHIVGMVRKPESVEVANFLMERLGKGGATAELIHPDELVSGIISQVAAEPDMAVLFSTFIYTTEGSEIYLRRPGRYQLPEDSEVAFAQVGELCRLRREIAIGYISQEGQVRMAPPSTIVHTYTPNDRIIVIAES